MPDSTAADTDGQDAKEQGNVFSFGFIEGVAPENNALACYALAVLVFLWDMPWHKQSCCKQQCLYMQAKIAKLKRELLEPASGSGGGGGERGFEVHKVGDARVGFVGAAPRSALCIACIAIDSRNVS